MFDLHGIVPPVVTPLNADESLDEAGLERQLSRLVDAGVHGMFFLGSTGEEPSLRDAERARAIAVAARVLNGRIPLIVGTMASSTARAIDNIRTAERQGADAVAVTPPHYYPSGGADEQIAHYRACAAATELPVIIYNIPSTTKVNMAAETMARIADIPNVIGLKDSSADFLHFLRILAAMKGRPDIRCLIGSPALTGAAILYGGNGGVPGVSNVDPQTMLDVYAAATAGDVVRLRELQPRVHALVKISSFGQNIVCLKTALELMGICAAHCTAPMQPLSPEKREGVAGVLRDLGLL